MSVDNLRRLAIHLSVKVPATDFEKSALLRVNNIRRAIKARFCGRCNWCWVKVKVPHFTYNLPISNIIQIRRGIITTKIEIVDSRTTWAAADSVKMKNTRHYVPLKTGLSSALEAGPQLNMGKLANIIWGTWLTHHYLPINKRL